MPIYRLGADAPTIHPTAYVAPNATLIGKVVLAENASVWFGAALRGDNEPIVIGANSNIQENAVLHTDMGSPLTIGANVTVGHQAMLHGCTIEDGALIGIQAVVLNHAVIGKHCLVGAGAVVTERRKFPDRSLVVGAPARVVRELSEAEVTGLLLSAEHYVRRGVQYRTELTLIA